MSICLNTEALTLSLSVNSAGRMALLPMAASISLADFSSITFSARRFDMSAFAELRLMASPTAFTVCIISIFGSVLTFVILIYPPPPLLLSTIYPCSGENLVEIT